MRHHRSALEAQLLRIAPRMRRFGLVLTQGAADSANALVAAAYDNIWRSPEKRQASRLDLIAFSEMVALWRERLADEAPPAAPPATATAPSAKSAVLSLPIDDRVVIGLMVIERLSVEQAADILNITPLRTSQIHARARRSLDVAFGAGRRAEGAA